MKWHTNAILATMILSSLGLTAMSQNSYATTVTVDLDAGRKLQTNWRAKYSGGLELDGMPVLVVISEAGLKNPNSADQPQVLPVHSDSRVYQLSLVAKENSHLQVDIPLAVKRVKDSSGNVMSYFHNIDSDSGFKVTLQGMEGDVLHGTYERQNGDQMETGSFQVIPRVTTMPVYE